MPRILVLNDTRDQQNWGSQACAQALVDILCARIPDAEVVTYPSAWLFQKHRQLPRWLGGRMYRHDKLGRIERRITEPVGIGPYVADEYEYIAERWLSGRSGPGPDEYVRDLRGFDAVVFNGEGSTYRANRAAILGLFMLWFARVQCQVPAFFLNGTVALTDVEAVLPAMVRKTFPVLDGITVREPRSVRNVEHYVSGVEVDLVPDSVFAYGPELAATPSPAVERLRSEMAGRPYCVVSSSMLPVDFSRSRGASALVELVRALQQVVPEVVLAGKDRGDQYLREVAALTGGRFFGDGHTYDELASLLGSAAFLVSGRYHTIILASILGCPSVPLSTTSPKVQGLCELMDGLIGETFDVTDLRSGTAAITARAGGYVRDGDALRARLVALSARHQEATARMGDILLPSLAAATTRPGGALRSRTDSDGGLPA